jgi:hypothetical protein
MDEQVNACLAPVPKERPSEWCVRALQFDEAQNHGPYSLTGSEYCAEPLDDFARLTIVQEVLVWGSQTRKTGTLMGGVAWSIKNDPCGILWAMPTQPLAQSFSETRWQKLLRASAEMAALIPAGAERHRFKNLEQQFRSGSVLNFVGSNSPANLASRPARRVVLDEVDKFDAGGGGEADAVDLAKQRTKGQINPQHWLTSTPTTVEGLIWQEYLKGDQRRFFMPCPSCRREVVFAWSKSFSTLPKVGCEAYVVWDKEGKRADGSWDFDRVHRSARFVCPHCAGDIVDSKKTWMIREGTWRATVTASAAGYVSRHLSSMYACTPSTSCGALAVKFLQAKNSLQGLQGMINGDFAEPYQLQDRQSERVELVRDSLVVTAEWRPLMTVDCQAKSPHFWTVVRQWNGGNSVGVYANCCDTVEELRDVQQRYKVPDVAVAVDSGFGAISEAEVYRTCARFSQLIQRSQGRKPELVGWIPIKGQPTRKRWRNDKKELVPFFWAEIDPFIGTDRAGLAAIKLLEYASDFFKDILENLRKGRTRYKWEVLEVPTALGQRTMGEGGMDIEVYWQHLDGQFRAQVLNKRTGRVSTEWTKRGKHWPDHVLDCEKSQVMEAMVYEMFVDG